MIDIKVNNDKQISICSEFNMETDFIKSGIEQSEEFVKDKDISDLLNSGDYESVYQIVFGKLASFKSWILISHVLIWDIDPRFLSGFGKIIDWTRIPFISMYFDQVYFPDNITMWDGKMDSKYIEYLSFGPDFTFTKDLFKGCTKIERIDYRGTIEQLQRHIAQDVIENYYDFLVSHDLVINCTDGFMLAGGKVRFNY